MDLVKAVEQQQLKKGHKHVSVGDHVKIHLQIKEGARERIQIFEGTIIARKGKGLSETITVRRISYGVGVERVFPLHSPRVERVEIVRKGRVRRAKLYYLRERVGKSARVRERLMSKEERAMQEE
ncbi:MAG: 50S ribosomal protein L19 [Clostridiaceae bacterium]|jgi:large subunit ribosomal protein L19|nr:50S ribosomal protein L19 [Bacillota bacterium]NLN52170.1 50S ribosomal protein L19 [Clostridiaceae bacterium]